MSFQATAQETYKEWEYIEDNIAQQRIEHLKKLTEMSGDTLLISLRDPDTGYWTKHLPIYDKSFTIKYEQYASFQVPFSKLRTAYDIHRSILWNEIVLETDYPDYEKNYEAAKIIGAILESKGFIPHYYYSGSKSLHLHIFLSLDNFSTIDIGVQDLIMNNFKPVIFRKEFIAFLRKKISTFWGLDKTLNLKSDEQVANVSKHLIRCELSKNKLGHKTFLGYTYKDLSFIPLIYNVQNGFIPKVGEIRYSVLNDPQELIEEFLKTRSESKSKKSLINKSQSLYAFFNPVDVDTTDIKKCIRFIMGDQFKPTDGYRRALYLLANDFVTRYGKDVALLKIREWNTLRGSPLRDTDIVYQCSRETHYTMSHAYIHNYLDGLGFEEKDYH